MAAAAILLLGTACSGDSTPTLPDGVDIPALVVTDTLIGAGAEAAAGRIVSLNYTGWLYSPSAPGNKGAQFDTSAGRGVLSFLVGGGGVIQGFDQGVRGMKVGGRRTIMIPSSLAYGRSGTPGIPPNSAIVFDLELVNVQ